jgi:hypothetical protein
VTLWHPLERRHVTFQARPPAWFEAKLA